MGLATLLWPQCKGRRAGYRAGCTDHCTGPTFRCLFVASPLKVGGCVVVRTWWTGYDGADIMTFPRNSCFLLHGCSLRRSMTGIHLLNGNFKWDDFQPVLYHYSVGSICKWTMVIIWMIFGPQIVLAHFCMPTSMYTECSWIKSVESRPGRYGWKVSHDSEVSHQSLWIIIDHF